MEAAIELIYDVTLSTPVCFINVKSVSNHGSRSKWQVLEKLKKKSIWDSSLPFDFPLNYKPRQTEHVHWNLKVSVESPRSCGNCQQISSIVENMCRRYNGNSESKERILNIPVTVTTSFFFS